MMSQGKFTTYVIPQILERFPFFQIQESFGSDENLRIEHKSNGGKLTLWLTTQGQEITLGFTGDSGLNDWHTHMELLGASTPDEEIQLASELISQIISGKQPIIFSSALGYFLSENPNGVYEYRLDNEAISVVSWQDL